VGEGAGSGGRLSKTAHAKTPRRKEVKKKKWIKGDKVADKSGQGTEGNEGNKERGKEESLILQRHECRNAAVFVRMRLHLALEPWEENGKYKMRDARHWVPTASLLLFLVAFVSFCSTSLVFFAPLRLGVSFFFYLDRP
jgi:hypothetical protein